MATIAIVGDGPGGLGAALFLARGDQRAIVFGDDSTAVNFAMLNNYLGAPGVPGPRFQETALEQVRDAGAEIRRARVTAIESAGDGFRVVVDDGTTLDADYLILSEGKTPTLAGELGLAADGDGAIAVDGQFRTSMAKVYAVGRSVRPRRSQVQISAGAGAVAALDILAEITGDDVQDWDSLPKDD